MYQELRGNHIIFLFSFSFVFTCLDFIMGCLQQIRDYVINDLDFSKWVLY